MRGCVPHAVEQAGFLLDSAALLDDLDLAAGFIFHRHGDEAHGIDVLDLAARAQMAEAAGLGELAHRDVDVGPHRAFVHAAVAGAQIADNRPQFLQKAAASSDVRICGLVTISIRAMPERFKST